MLTYKLICPNCKTSSAPIGPKTFQCVACGYRANFTFNIDNTAHWFKTGRRPKAEKKKGVSVKIYPSVDKRLKQRGVSHQQAFEIGITEALK